MDMLNKGDKILTTTWAIKMNLMVSFEIESILTDMNGSIALTLKSQI
jgi:hypothetical protein